MREPPHNAVLLEPPTEKVVSLAWEEAVALVKFKQVEAGKRNFFVSPFLEVRERNLQGGLGNLASLKRKTLQPPRKYTSAVTVLCEKGQLTAISVMSGCPLGGCVL